jgi:glycosyltransferase involved in cell wall biosynthesis
MSDEKRVLCAVPTKNRYDVLYHCLQAVAMQTLRPDKLIIYDDGKREDMRENPIGAHLARLLSSREIDWEVIFTPGIGQHVAHQISNTSGYEFVWRLDDDNVPEPDVLERLMSHMSPEVGGVGGAVFEPGKPVMGGSSRMEDFFLGGNVQWGPGQGVHEVDHLYSSFLYRAGIVNYKHNMTNVAFHEETIFSYRLKLAGYRLIADTDVRTYHFRSPYGGCRSVDSKWAYELDHREFMRMAEEEWGIKVIHLGAGLGDCLMFKHIIPELLAKYRTVVVGSCYNQALEGTGAKLVPYECVKQFASDNVYDWASERQWKGSLIEAFREMYGLNNTNLEGSDGNKL